VKLPLLVASVTGLAACSSSAGSSVSTTESSAEHARSTFLPLASIRLGWADGGPFQAARLPVLARRNGAPCVAALHLRLPVRLPDTPEAEARKAANEVSVPVYVVYVDAKSGAKLESTGFLNADRQAHFGIPDPKDEVVGHWDDPQALGQERVNALRARILAAFDVLLPLFADQDRPFPEDAYKAAREVRDFFPLAAEPGLWPYYKAEGRDFFAWVERHAPPAKTRLPWEAEKQ